jgi:hypothetical protein
MKLFRWFRKKPKPEKEPLPEEVNFYKYWDRVQENAKQNHKNNNEESD